MISIWLAEAIELKDILQNYDEEKLEKPLTYHNRTNQVLPYEGSKVQKQMEEIE